MTPTERLSRLNEADSLQRTERIFERADLDSEIKRNPTVVQIEELVERIQFSPDEAIRLAAVELGIRALKLDGQIE